MVLQSILSYKYHPRGVVVAVSFLDQMVPGSIPLAANFFFQFVTHVSRGVGSNPAQGFSSKKSSVESQFLCHIWVLQIIHTY